MSQGEWVLLSVMLGLLGPSSIASRVDSASLSGVTSTNHVSPSGVCAGLCDAGLAVKSCRVFCTSRRQSRIQSDTVTGGRDVVDVGDTRRDACPTPCQHGFDLPTCNCAGSRVSDPGVSWKKICDLFCKDDDRSSGCPECLKTQARRRTETMRKIRTGTMSRSPREVLAPRGSSVKSYVTGVGFFEMRTTEGETANADGTNVDWEEFCKIECARGNGGIACNCDIIP